MLRFCRKQTCGLQTRKHSCRRSWRNGCSLWQKSFMKKFKWHWNGNQLWKSLVHDGTCHFILEDHSPKWKTWSLRRFGWVQWRQDGHCFCFWPSDVACCTAKPARLGGRHRPPRCKTNGFWMFLVQYIIIPSASNCSSPMLAQSCSCWMLLWLSFGAPPFFFARSCHAGAKQFTRLILFTMTAFVQHSAWSAWWSPILAQPPMAAFSPTYHCAPAINSWPYLQ